MIGTGEFELSGWLLTRERSATEVDLAALVEEHGATLFRVAHSILRCRSEAEDAVQDTFVRVLEHRRSLPEVRDLRVWLVRIVWNLAVDRRRKLRPEQMDEVFAATLAARLVPADEALGEAQEFAALMQAIEKLPKLERQVLLLSALEELGTAEVAKVIGKSESATRALLFRARTRLKERTKGGRG
jgi:RNA polymerase sigma-70 factor (ECF subfamily)